MTPRWFSNHVAYTMAKYGMSMYVLGMHEEFKPLNIAVNALWPRTAIHTAAIEMLFGLKGLNQSRKPEIMGDAAYYILCQEPKAIGNFFIDEEVLKNAGVTDFDQYCVNSEYKDKLLTDYYFDDKSLSDFIRVSEKATAKVEKASSDGQVADLFRVIENSLNPKLVETVQAVYQFEMSGQEAGRWYLDLKTGSGKCGKGDAPAPPDATLKMDSKNFFDMFTGKLKPASAYMMGKLKISGNMQKALKLEKLMGHLKAKL